MTGPAGTDRPTILSATPAPVTTASPAATPTPVTTANPATTSNPVTTASAATSLSSSTASIPAAHTDLDLDQRDGPDAVDPEPRDWAWVEEWREGREPMPWGPGLAIAGFTAFLVASAVYVLSTGLSSRPLVAIGVNVVVVAGLCPALWLSRGLPVLRWIAGGAAAGVLVAWLSVLVFLT